MTNDSQRRLRRKSAVRCYHPDMDESLLSPVARSSESPTRLPAWALSCAVHLLAVAAMALLFRGPGVAGQEGEPLRAAAVVLASDADGETQYFDQPSAEAAAADAAAAETASGEAAEAPLPPPDTAPDLPDLQLPGELRGGLAAGLLDGPDLGVAGRRDAVDRAGPSLEELLAAERAGQKPAPILGPKGRLTLFGAPSDGRSFVFVIDRSHSMGRAELGALLAAQRELQSALSGLTERQSFDIVAYHHSPVSFSHLVTGRNQLVPATEEHRAQVARFFAGLAAFGATKHDFALYAALDLKPEVIYLLTDGGDPFLSPSQMRDIPLRARRIGCSIHCIQFGARALLEDEGRFMELLAERAGGGYRFVNLRETGRAP